MAEKRLNMPRAQNPVIANLHSDLHKALTEGGEHSPVPQGSLRADKKMQKVVNNAGRCQASSMIKETQLDTGSLQALQPQTWDFSMGPQEGSGSLCLTWHSIWPWKGNGPFWNTLHQS